MNARGESAAYRDAVEKLLAAYSIRSFRALDAAIELLQEVHDLIQYNRTSVTIRENAQSWAAQAAGID